MPGITPFQTVGPFFDIMVRGRRRHPQVTDATVGTRIVIEGRIIDGVGQPIPDALVETWQADANGRYRHPEDQRPGAAADPTFDGYGWMHTHADGSFSFDTIKPGPVPGPDGREQAPHVLVSIMGRGILTRFVTRMYFDDEPANAADPILALVPEERRHTLIGRGAGNARYHLDIVMQGANETVFFDV
jgi:protocatechuate 3,4-dioxygenase alpha subunit